MRTILENEVMIAALEVMAFENPGKHMPHADVTPHFAHIQLGAQTGYAIYENRLRLLGKGIEIPQADPAADYPDDQPQPDQ